MPVILDKVAKPAGRIRDAWHLLASLLKHVSVIDLPSPETDLVRRGVVFGAGTALGALPAQAIAKLAPVTSPASKAIELSYLMASSTLSDWNFAFSYRSEDIPSPEITRGYLYGEILYDEKAQWFLERLFRHKKAAYFHNLTFGDLTDPTVNQLVPESFSQHYHAHIAPDVVEKLQVLFGSHTRIVDVSRAFDNKNIWLAEALVRGEINSLDMERKRDILRTASDALAEDDPRKELFWQTEQKAQEKVDAERERQRELKEAEAKQKYEAELAKAHSSNEKLRTNAIANRELWALLVQIQVLQDINELTEVDERRFLRAGGVGYKLVSKQGHTFTLTDVHLSLFHPRTFEDMETSTPHPETKALRDLCLGRDFILIPDQNMDSAIVLTNNTLLKRCFDSLFKLGTTEAKTVIQLRAREIPMPLIPVRYQANSMGARSPVPMA